MKLKRGWIILGGVGLVAVIVAVVLVRENEPASTERNAMDGEGSEVQTATSQETDDLFSETGLREPASVPPASAGKAVTERPSAFKNFSYTKELQDYMQLKAKVFMTDTEKEKRASLLANSSFLRGAGELLRAPAVIESEDFDHQSRAMDLLLEALSSPSKGVAAEVLRDVVADPQIENDKLELETRRSLAGVKAEVMYQWSAIDPESAQRMPSWLPGPTSQKIWRNVLEMQEQNRLESVQEMVK